MSENRHSKAGRVEIIIHVLVFVIFKGVYLIRKHREFSLCLRYWIAVLVGRTALNLITEYRQLSLVLSCSFRLIGRCTYSPVLRRSSHFFFVGNSRLHYRSRCLLGRGIRCTGILCHCSNLDLVCHH